uniref:Uncharacterized protein n=1 Tax=Moniliophthora roreri TaxID=221103 RepID=A0A0W0F4I7_MONRR
MSESITWIDCQMGLFAQGLTKDEDFTMNGPISVPHPPDIEVLPLYVIIPKTDTTPTSPLSSSQPENTEEQLEEQLRSLKDSSFLTSDNNQLISLRLMQEGAWTYLAPILEEQESHPYLPTSEPFSTLYTPLSQSPTEQLCPECPEPQTPQFLTPPSMLLPLPSSIDLPVQSIHRQALSEQQDSPWNSSLPLSPLTQTPVVRIQSVWDDEDEDQEDRDLQIENRSTPLMLSTMEWVNKVYSVLNALFAEWETTVPSTVETTIVQFAELLRLGISLKTAMTNKGLQELQERTILAAIWLLTMIGEMIPCGMMRSIETERAERPDRPSPTADSLTVDLGEPEGPRTFFFVGQRPEFHSKWLVGGRNISNADI